MKKIKRIVTIALAATMLLGMTLTAKAETVSPVSCPNCYLYGPVIHVSCEGTLCQWYCRNCHIYFKAKK